MHKMSTTAAHDYMDLYRRMHRTQTNLRLPAIILSSFTGVASFGTSSFPLDYQKYVSIVCGLLNISIAMIQTYESYLKIGDIVSKSLQVASGLQKLADDIECELAIPIENRDTNGITFLRDCFSRYKAVIYQAPPLEIEDEETNQMVATIKKQLRKIEMADAVETPNNAVSNVPSTASPFNNTNTPRNNSPGSTPTRGSGLRQILTPGINTHTSTSYANPLY